MLFTALLVACSMSAARAAPAIHTFPADFAVVMIDDTTEKKLGPFPYDRAKMAAAVDACGRLHAKAVVLKFFFDQAKSSDGDAALARAMGEVPVAIQACLNSDDGLPQDLPARFEFEDVGARAKVRGVRGWIPLPALMEAASRVGFVDFNSPDIPLVERYRGAPYESLVLCCLELATGTRASSPKKGRIEIGEGFLPVDPLNVYRATPDGSEAYGTISFANLLEGSVDEGEIRGRVVIIGMDTAKMPTLTTPAGAVGIHRYFVQCLASAYRDLVANRMAPSEQ